MIFYCSLTLFGTSNELTNLRCKKIEIWGGLQKIQLSLDQLNVKFLFNNLLEIERQSPVISSFNFLDSYVHPEFEIVFLSDSLNFKNSKNIAMAILNAKKTNAKYLCSIFYQKPHSGCYQAIHKGPFGVPFPINILYNLDEDISDQKKYDIAIYKIDDIQFPAPELICNNGITLLTNSLKNPSQQLWYHQGVLRSILRGLEKIRAVYNYNPTNMSQIHENVLVLCNNEPFQEALQLKKTVISKLCVGPNYIFNQDFLEADNWIVPGLWTKEYFSNAYPMMSNKIQIWPAGVDTEFWKPQKKQKLKLVLLYKKTSDDYFCHQIERLLRSFGWDVLVIEYGKYTLESFKEALDKVQFAVFVSMSESQGIALAESWSMDIPTLVWENYNVTYQGVQYPSNSAPYLNKNNGCFWKDLDQLDGILRELPQKLLDCQPRKWVLRNMSDEVSVFDLLRIYTAYD